MFNKDLKDRVSYIEHRLEGKVDNYYHLKELARSNADLIEKYKRLERSFNTLMDHLQLEIENVPSHLEIKDKI